MRYAGFKRSSTAVKAALQIQGKWYNALQIQVVIMETHFMSKEEVLFLPDVEDENRVKNS